MPLLGPLQYTQELSIVPGLIYLVVGTVRARRRRLSGLSVFHSKSVCMALLYGRAGRLTDQTGGFRPG